MAGGFAAALPTGRALAQRIPPAGTSIAVRASAAGEARDLQLEVFINGASTELIAAFRQEADGTLTIAPDQLRNVGILPKGEAEREDGRIDISRLPGVSFDYDEAGQSIRFSVAHDALSVRIIDAHWRAGDATLPDAQSSFGAYVNYTLFASTGGDRLRDLWDHEGVSAWLDGHLFSPYGVLSGSYVAATSSSELRNSSFTRLDTTWSSSNPGTMVSYRAGDVITGGLSWTRPVRLGGVQIQRNFGLRPDLVTIPLPEISGSAVVPSTVDVFIDSTRRFSRQVPAGPFQIVNLPVVTGGGTARVVTRNALGQETVIESPFFASTSLLAPGLWNFSAEAGFARRFYGIESNNYDGRLMAAGTLGYGLNDRLTLEGHVEGGGGLISGGVGAAFGLGSHAVGTFAGAASSYGGRTGFLVSGSVDLALRDWRVYARTRRTFEDFNDIASVTIDFERDLLPDGYLRSAAPPRVLDQVSVSVPLRFDPSRFSFSYTHLKTAEGDRSRFFGLSFSRRIGNGASLFATAYRHLDEEKSSGVFVSLLIPLDDNIHASTAVSSDSDGTAVTLGLTKPERAEVGSVSWRLRDTEGAYTRRAASISYRAPFARFETGVEQYEDRYRATGAVDGAIVFAGNDVFLSNRIDDAFAIVDVGVPGIEVQYENRPAGHTNRRGKLLLPRLRSYQRNNIAIDPTNLPIDAIVNSTREIAVPADRSGIVVKFDVDAQAQSALVTLRNEEGQPLETGATGQLEGSPERFVVGYDGQAFVTGLGPRNRVIVEQPTRGRCVAEFDFEPRSGEQVTIPDVICRAIE